MRDWEGSIREMWRIPNEKSESGLFSCLELRGGSPHPCRLRTDCLTLVRKFNYVLVHVGFMGSRKPSSFCNCLVKP
jgi:hypothetical protein